MTPETHTEKSPDARKAELRELVALFRDNIVQYKGPNYDEANTRTDFIDKFFELLGLTDEEIKVVEHS